jgi:hypothetical protein
MDAEVHPEVIVNIHEELKEVEYLLSVPFIQLKKALPVFGIEVKQIEKPKLIAYKLIPCNSDKENIGFPKPNNESVEYYAHKSNIIVNDFELLLRYPEPGILSIFENHAEIAQALWDKKYRNNLIVDAGILSYVQNIGETYGAINQVIKNKIKEDKSILTYCVDTDISDFIKQYYTLENNEESKFYSEVHKELNMIFR